VDSRQGRGVPPPPRRELQIRAAPGSRATRRVPDRDTTPPRPKQRAVHSLVVLVLVLAIVAITETVVHITSKGSPPATANQAAADPDPPPVLPRADTLRERIVQIAKSQLGYRTDPPNTYCNKYSAYFVAGNDDCGNSNLDEEWCADFAAWVWKQAGAMVNYQFVNGDINSSAASFYEWGIQHGTWHSAYSGYQPQPGDVAVYGLDPDTLVAAHVAVVVSYTKGQAGPDVVNGDGDHTGFSVVESGTDQYKADAPGSVAYLSGYTSPTPAG
jgi:CHAP domain